MILAQSQLSVPPAPALISKRKPHRKVIISRRHRYVSNAQLFLALLILASVFKSLLPRKQPLRRLHLAQFDKLDVGSGQLLADAFVGGRCIRQRLAFNASAFALRRVIHRCGVSRAGRLNSSSR